MFNVPCLYLGVWKLVRMWIMAVSVSFYRTMPVRHTFQNILSGRNLEY